MPILSRNLLDRAVINVAAKIFNEALDLTIYLDHYHAITLTSKGKAQRFEDLSRKLSGAEYFNRPPHDLTIHLPSEVLDYSGLNPEDRMTRKSLIEARKWYFGSEDAAGAVAEVTRWIDEGNCVDLYFPPDLDKRPGKQ